MPSSARTDQLLQQFRSFCTSGYLLTRPYKKWNVPINHFCSSVDVSKTWDWHTFVLTSIANCEPNNLDAYHANANSSHTHMKVFTQPHEFRYIQSIACGFHYEYHVKLLMVWAKTNLCCLIFFYLDRPNLVVTGHNVQWDGQVGIHIRVVRDLIQDGLLVDPISSPSHLPSIAAAAAATARQQPFALHVI